MTRAWAIVRETYSYPRISFRSIGRPCFARALREAWKEARQAAEITTTPTDGLEARVAGIAAELEA
jgi:hypothetical protein